MKPVDELMLSHALTTSQSIGKPSSLTTEYSAAFPVYVKEVGTTVSSVFFIISATEH